MFIGSSTSINKCVYVCMHARVCVYVKTSLCWCVFCRRVSEMKKKQQPNSTFEAINFRSVWLVFCFGRGSQTDKIIVLVKPYTVTVNVFLSCFLLPCFNGLPYDKIVSGFIFIPSSFSLYFLSSTIFFRYQMSHTAADLYRKDTAIECLDVF